MFEVRIPGYENISICNVVLDFNGTIATDGIVSEETKEQLRDLAKVAEVYVITADTNGTVKAQCSGLPLQILTFTGEVSGTEKKRIVEEIGPEYTVCVGNGYNDAPMFEIAKLSIIVLGEEGLSTKALLAADIMVKDTQSALDFLLKPNRMIATLRR